MNRRGARSDERGFTLIEAVIAFAIVATALGVLIHAFSQGMRSADVSADQLTALMQARSMLDTVGRELPLVEGAQQGRFQNGFPWSVTIDRYQSPNGTEAATDAGPVPYQVEVTVSPPAGQPVTLATIRLGVVQP